MNKRITILRNSLNLNQDDFGKKINVTRSAISNYEKGLRNITPRVINDICREFNVNEEWLRFGIGEIFKEEAFSLDKYAKEKGATSFDIELIKIYLDMPDDLRNRLKDLFLKNN